MLRLTVSASGSGTSTLVKALPQYWLKSANGGDIFRDHAKKRGLTVEEFSSLCRENLDVDRALDVALKSLMMDQSGPEIVESRLSGWWAKGLNRYTTSAYFNNVGGAWKKANAKRWRILRG